jgi:hypothetical protein
MNKREKENRKEELIDDSDSPLPQEQQPPLNKTIQLREEFKKIFR